MTDKNKRPTSCSSCLREFLKLADSEIKQWEQLGRDQPQCDDCVEALKSKHAESKQLKNG